MVSTAGGIIIALVVLLGVAAAGWLVFAQLRARRLGLPPPSLSSYLPWRQSDNAYGPPRPAPGGITGWVNDQMRKLKQRGNRSAGDGYEQTTLHAHGGGAGRRGFGPLDPDEAWDARVGAEADGYGLYDEHELGPGRGRSTEYRGGEYTTNLAPLHPQATSHDDTPSRGRMPPSGQNPFDDDAGSSLRGVSPRPLDTQRARSRGESHGSDGGSPTERRSVFRENVV
ncbi:hypothetical protein CDD82_5636 [Ophiocordyceps australis]|uniref:Uncharacterized protein n=1 Tax=Ophiocordyceps australis TaxID=1399860 RepID=A0A2C5YZD7_9HYPO|nr:hypothetical protein CDD82_5636 [Ophiocordyceps australis]